jgi:hypothetical protein
VPDAGKVVVADVPSTPIGRPTVAVIVTCYNYGRFLTPCVESALAQRDVDVEVIIVDDASTDETPQVARILSERDSRVTVVRNALNRGMLPSVNAALALASAEYLVKLDADDLLAPGSLARSSALMETYANVTFVYGLPVHFAGAVPPMADTRTHSWSVWNGRAWLARRCRTGTNVVSQPEVLMRASAVHEVGPFRENLPHTSDLHLWLQLAATGDVGRVNGPPQGYYRVHDESMQRTVHAGVLTDLRGRRDAFESFFEHEGRQVSGAEGLRCDARRALAVTALAQACRAYDRRQADESMIKELIRFATETYPAVGDLPEWRALVRRQATSDPFSPRIRRFTDGAARRLHVAIGHRRWERTGEW